MVVQWYSCTAVRQCEWSATKKTINIKVVEIKVVEIKVVEIKVVDIKIVVA